VKREQAHLIVHTTAKSPTSFLSFESREVAGRRGWGILSGYLSELVALHYQINPTTALMLP
jgi:hypothetical protein